MVVVSIATISLRESADPFLLPRPPPLFWLAPRDRDIATAGIFHFLKISSSLVQAINFLPTSQSSQLLLTSLSAAQTCRASSHCSSSAPLLSQQHQKCICSFTHTFPTLSLEALSVQCSCCVYCLDHAPDLITFVVTK